MAKRVYLVTKEKYNEYRRQLAWFSRHLKGLYYSVFMLAGGSHYSYHMDGKIWRTPPYLIKGNKKRQINRYFPLNNFHGVLQLDACMVVKEHLQNNPPLTKRHVRKAMEIREIDLELFPNDSINVIVEFFETGNLLKTLTKEYPPPPNANTIVIDCIEPWIVLTVLGHKNNLLVKPNEDGFRVFHYNDRFSLNRKGIEYLYEAYKI